MGEAKKRKDFDRILRWGSPSYDIVSLLKETGAIPEVAPAEEKIDAAVATKAGAEFLKQNNNVYAKLGKSGFTLVEEKEPEEKKAETEEKPEGKKAEEKAEEKKEDTKKEEKKEKPKKSADKLMEEQNISKTLFWTLEEGDFEKLLEIKKFGVRK